MLLTKLYKPKTKSYLVYRLKLAEKLDKAQSKKLVLVSAPAGYGKTTFVSQWLEKNNHPSVWYSLDTSDNDSSAFLSYIITGLQSIKKDFGAGALKLLNSPNNIGVESVTALIISDLLQLDEDVYVVLDDFHLITHDEILKAVKYLLSHMPDQLHLLILTRSDPPLSMARLRSHNQLLEIRLGDLSFSVNETSNFFNKKLKFGLNKTDIAALESKTEGWIAGLQLAALSMQGMADTSAFIASLAGNNRYIMDYLIEEVLRVQPGYIQEFLLKTSVLKQISAPLCDNVLSRTDSQLILEKLEKENMFVVPLDMERKWYRYHHLFADLLKQRCRLENSTAFEEIQVKAGQWFDENGIFDLAIEHTLAVKDFEGSLRTIAKVVEKMWNNGKHAAILNYGESLPDERIKTNPVFSLYYAWILIAGGDVEKAFPFLESAESLTKNAMEIEDSTKGKPQLNDREGRRLTQLYGKIAVAFAYLYSHDEDAEKMHRYWKIGLENLTEEDPLWHSWAWFTCGLAYFAEGKLQESAEALNTSFSYAQTTGNVYLISTILSRLGEIEQQLGRFQSAYDRCAAFLSYMNDKGYGQVSKTEWIYAPLYQIMGVTELGWAELDKASENLKIAYRLCKKGTDNFFRIYTSIIYSVFLNYNGDSEGLKIAGELDELIQKTTVPPFLLSFYISSKIYWCIELNQIEQANNFLASYGINEYKEINYSYEMAYAAYARLLIHQFRLSEAETLLNKLYDYALANKEADRMIELDFAFIDLYELQGKREKAVDRLISVLEKTALENQLFSIVYWAGKLKPVLNEVYRIHASSKTNIPQKFMDKIQLVIKNEEKRRKRKAETFLSKREMETLQLLSEDLSNQEIADKLYISLNTVKTRLKNIFIKLEVDNRRKAVRQAKERGLL